MQPHSRSYANVLVTGGAGFIGSHLVRLLVHRGCHVLNFDKLTYAGNKNALADLESNNQHHWCIADLCNRSSVADAIENFRPEAIVHLAAESHVDRSISQPDAFIQSNIVGTYHLLQCALEYFERLPASHKEHFRFVHISTDEVFGSLGPTGSFNEASSYQPHSPYSASKAASDHLVRAWRHTYNLPAHVLNSSNTYGPNQFPEKLIPATIVRALRGEPIAVYGNGENVRDWLFVGDHCSAIEAILTRGSLGKDYVIGGNNQIRNIDLVQTICATLDRIAPRSDGASYANQIRFVEDRPGHDWRYAIDTACIQSELGWSPRQDWLQGIELTVNWYVERFSPSHSPSQK